MKKIKIGFLPFYIKLYDDCGSGAVGRPRLEPFYERLACELEARGFEVIRNEFCRIKPEFEAAVAKFEAAGADCIVTWHAAYSPSLESIDTLAATELPIIVLDTTETYDFSPEQDPAEISFCHGIHGVMDMCSLLRQRGKGYAICAGHIEHTDVLDRVAGYARAAGAARSLKGSRAGSIGGSFDGMGDFLIDDVSLLERFGVTAVYPKDGEIEALRNSVTEAEVEAEMKENSELFYEIEPIDPEAHAETVRNCLAVRKFIENNELDAFTINFRKIGGDSGITAMPFIEACKAMARGIGYAGEGDILTASLVGALRKAYRGATFAEIFCPDWKNGSLLISHMGEYNLDLVKGKPGYKKIKFIFAEGALDPVVSYGCYRPGKAVFINLYKGVPGLGYCLFISPIEMLDVPERAFEFKVRGWFKPSCELPEFLEKLSLAGATHHSAIIYDATVEEMRFFAGELGLPAVVVE